MSNIKKKLTKYFFYITRDIQSQERQSKKVKNKLSLRFYTTFNKLYGCNLSINIQCFSKTKNTTSLLERPRKD